MKKQSRNLAAPFATQKISFVAGVITPAPLNIAEVFAKNDNNVFELPQKKHLLLGGFAPKKPFFSA